MKSIKRVKALMSQKFKPLALHILSSLRNDVSISPSEVNTSIMKTEKEKRNSNFYKTSEIFLTNCTPSC